MEEDYEQLDYDEEELKNALKKAQQLKKIDPEEQGPKPLIQNAFLSDATKEVRDNVSSKCYINPMFAKQGVTRKAPSFKNSSFMAPNHFFCHPLQNSHQHYNQKDVYLSQCSQNVTNIQPIVSQMSWSTSHSSNFTYSQTGYIPNNIYINPSVLNTPQPYFHNHQLQRQQSSQSFQNWHSMVDDFVKKTISVSPRVYSKNHSSPSDSSFSARSRSSSRSNSKDSCSASPPAQKKQTKRNKSRSKREQIRPKKTELSKQTIECAKAIGLDSEYLKKIEEQKKLREEIARKKSQHRKEIYTREGQGNEQKSEMKELQRKKAPEKEATSRQKTTNRLRPYLAVVVTNLSGLDDPCRKVAVIANKIGPIKKIWQESESNVHMIFEKHEDAKKFMQQYIGNYTFFGRVIDVIMRKVFLNTPTVV